MTNFFLRFYVWQDHNLLFLPESDFFAPLCVEIIHGSGLYTVRNNSAEVLNFVTLFCPVFWHAWGVPSPSVTYCHSWRVRGWAPQLLEVIGCERFRCNPWMDNTSGVKPWTLYVNLQEHLSMDASSMAKNGTSRCYRWGVTPFNASQLSVQIITLQPFIKTHFGHKFYFNPANRNWYTINEVWT